MAIAKLARVTSAESLGAGTRLLSCASAEPLGFRGGQYVIVDSGLVQPNGKAVKRAYSLLTSDAEQTHFQLVVKRIDCGRGSDFMHRLEVGSEFSFSGPWGKFFPSAQATGSTLLLATDTGISAVLGLCQGSAFQPLLSQTTLIWLRVAADYFVPESFVRERLSTACGELRIEMLPPIANPERVDHARSVLQQVMARGRLSHALLAGDGAVNYALLDELVAAGVPATRDSVESFFNMPKKSG